MENLLRGVSDSIIECLPFCNSISLQWVLELTFFVELQNPKALVKCQNYFSGVLFFTHWCLLLAFSLLFAAIAIVIKALIPSLQPSINLILMLFTLVHPIFKKKLSLISMLIIDFNAISAQTSVEVMGLHSHCAVYSRLILREMCYRLRFPERVVTCSSAAVSVLSSLLGYQFRSNV